MKKGFYPKLAWTGIRKNKRLYTPYLLTCIGMVMVFYIVCFLAGSDTLATVRGGETMQSILGLGVGVMGVFALIFLFYTNSFLTRRRKKEFGLYNILGMGKRNLVRVLAWESLITAGISLGGGLFTGILFSKFAELVMINILKADVNFSLTLNPQAVWRTILLFCIIFGLIFLNTLRQVHLASPIELLHSENTGEKPPKANWIFALAGAVILAAAYWLAVTIEEPVTALIWFFAAVVMVIIATYLLFVSGSVTVCRLLQKRKKYYYKTNHFVSVSSMAFRMKRSGAGLASICILCTMVLVMLSATTCLYAGAEDSLRSRYPRNISINATFPDTEALTFQRLETMREAASQTVEKNGQEEENILDYTSVQFAGYIQNGRVDPENSSLYAFQMRSYADVWQVFVLPIEDYNQVMGKNEVLEADEALVYTTKSQYDGDTIAIADGQPLKVRKADSFVRNGTDAMQVVPSIYIFVPDLAECIEPLLPLVDDRGNHLVTLHWFYGFDLDCHDDLQIKINEEIRELLRQPAISDKNVNFSAICESSAKERADFYGLYGGLFFLGILLGAVFLFAAVLIMYYKQISEGYEDQSRFEIMQKVGMTKRDIRRSINSQMLTVFLLPLLAAGIHLAFAFPMLQKLLVLFSMSDASLLTAVTVCCFVVFALFYMLVYRITSGAYYSIVSGARRE